MTNTGNRRGTGRSVLPRMVLALAAALLVLPSAPSAAAVTHEIDEFEVPTTGMMPGIGTGPDHALWFSIHGARSGNGLFGRIGAKSTRINEYESSSVGHSTHDVVAGPDGNLWFGLLFEGDIARMKFHRGQVLVRDGEPVIERFELPGDYHMTDLIVGPDGNIWFLRSHEPWTGEADKPSTVGRIDPLAADPGGSVMEFPTEGIALHSAIAAAPDGIWFTQSNARTVARVSVTGAITEYPLPEGHTRPEGVTWGPDGAVWFTEFNQATSNSAIGRLDPTAAVPGASDGFSSIPTPTRYSHPFEITAGPDGALWFTEHSADAIGRITTTGEIEEYPIPIGGGPQDIEAGPDGNIWFTERAQGYVGRVCLRKTC